MSTPTQPLESCFWSEHNNFLYFYLPLSFSPSDSVFLSFNWNRHISVRQIHSPSWSLQWWGSTARRTVCKDTSGTVSLIVAPSRGVIQQLAGYQQWVAAMTHSPCSHFAEVSLWLEGIGCQSSKHSTGQEQGLQHSGVLIEGHCWKKNSAVRTVYQQAQTLGTDRLLSNYLQAVATDTASSRVCKQHTVSSTYTLSS